MGRALIAALLVLLTAPLAQADDKTPAAQLPPKVETRHTITLDGKSLGYRAIAETFALADQKGDTTASVFTVAYIADAPAGSQRPVAFVFNGGPGAASVFLHLGALGPRILETPGDGSLPNPPYKLVDNPNCWLAFTDLVFVDPVGTGFSHGEEKKPDGKDDGKGGNPDKPFWNVRGDLTSLGSVLRLWLTRHERWPSPVYLVGESYGGYRVAALAQTLVEDIGLTPNGLVMISPALDMSLIRDNVRGPVLRRDRRRAFRQAVFRRRQREGRAIRARGLRRRPRPHDRVAGAGRSVHRPGRQDDRCR
jgi:carboxypeptidase C (cathepsin A)